VGTSVNNLYANNLHILFMEDKLASIDTDSLLSLNIPELRLITENSVVIGARGQTLSTLKKRWLLEKIKYAGIYRVIDLRAGDHSESFPNACREVGLEYLHFPIDKSRTPDAEIIERLPVFIETINSGGFYIACALGLHRTDIALSLRFIFDPTVHDPPTLYGHFRDGKLRYDDIFQRAGSIIHKLKEWDKIRLGWDESLDHMFIHRKKALRKYQEDYFGVSH